MPDRRALALLLLSVATLCATQPAPTPLERGRALMQGVVACGNCPAPQGPQGPAPDRAGGPGAGGIGFSGPWGRSVASNVTPTGLGRYGDAALRTVITTGVRPDGSRLKPPTGVGHYA